MDQYHRRISKNHDNSQQGQHPPMYSQSMTAEESVHQIQLHAEIKTDFSRLKMQTIMTERRPSSLQYRP